MIKSAREIKSITLDPQIQTNARKIQARLIEKTDKGWSVSAILNILAIAGMSQAKKMSKTEWKRARSMIESKSVKIEDSDISEIIRKLA